MRVTRTIPDNWRSWNSRIVHMWGRLHNRRDVTDSEKSPTSAYTPIRFESAPFRELIVGPMVNRSNFKTGAVVVRADVMDPRTISLTKY